MRKSEKAQVVEGLKASLQAAPGFILADHTGLSVPQMQDLRRRFAEAQVRYRVVKNTLLRRALDACGRTEFEPHLVGATSVALIGDDPVAAAKALHEFAEEYGIPRIKAGWVEGRVLEAEAIKALAAIPTREVLQARLVWFLGATATGLVTLLEAPLRDAVYTFEAYAQRHDAEPAERAEAAGEESAQEAAAEPRADTPAADSEGGTTDAESEAES